MDKMALMGAKCRNLCNIIKMPTPQRKGGFYANGFKRCSYCVWWVSVTEMKKLGYNENRCPCCNLLLKMKPNSKHARSVIERKLQA